MAERNILLIMTDQQRADTLMGVQADPEVMPNVRALGERARFSCCQSVNPICTPARASLITGRYSRQIGCLTMSGDLRPQIPTFPQALQGAGYVTYGVGKFHYLQTYPWSTPRGQGLDLVALAPRSRAFGYDEIWETAGKQQTVTNNCFYGAYLRQRGLLEQVRDFYVSSGGANGDTADHNYDKAQPWPFPEEDYIDHVTGREARNMLAGHDASKPFFMLLSFCGPHKPYDAPQSYLDRFPLEERDDFVLDGGKTLSSEEKERLYRQRRQVKAMLRLIDDEIGLVIRLLKERDMWENTLVLFTSDHGDMLGDHYLLQKGTPWKQALNVPLAVRLPGAGPIGENASPVELTDITATLLDYAGLEPARALSRAWPAYNDRIPGRSLMPVLLGTTEAVREYAYAESDFTEERAPGSDIQDTIRKRGQGRSNAWRALVSKQVKYVRYLPQQGPGECREELYDLTKDPMELTDVSPRAEYARLLGRARRYMDAVTDWYAPCQTTWADGGMD